MNPRDAIGKNIAGLREEVERQYRERLASIDRLEAELLGKAPEGSQAPTSQGDSSEQGAVGKEGAPKTTQVLHALSEATYKTIPQICEETGLNHKDVRGALYAKSLQAQILKRKSKGKTVEFCKAGPREPGQPRGVVSSAVQRVLLEHPDGLKASEVISRLPSLNHKTIGATLYNMKKRGAAEHDEETGVYRLATTNGKGR